MRESQATVRQATPALGSNYTRFQRLHPNEISKRNLFLPEVALDFGSLTTLFIRNDEKVTLACAIIFLEPLNFTYQSTRRPNRLRHSFLHGCKRCVVHKVAVSPTSFSLCSYRVYHRLQHTVLTRNLLRENVVLYYLR